MHTLQDTGLGARRRTALIANEIARYNIYIAALSESRRPEEGSLVEIGTGYHYGVVYPMMSVAFMALYLHLGLRFCGVAKNPTLQ